MHLTLESVTRVSPKARAFRFRSAKGAVPFAAGQFYRFVFEDDEGPFERSYSLANHGAPDDVADLLISEVEGGRATRVLWSAEPGLEVVATGPFGRLTLPEPLPERVILVAASVGLAPFLPMFDELEGPLRDGRVRVVVIFGIRNPAELLAADLLHRLQTLPGFELHVCHSREMPESAGPGDHPGYVQDTLARVGVDGQSDVVLLCGNPPMVQACRELLNEQRFPRKRVRREPYVFAPRIEATRAGGPTDAERRLIAEKMAKHRRDQA